jgi:hypothetical protein
MDSSRNLSTGNNWYFASNNSSTANTTVSLIHYFLTSCIFFGGEFLFYVVYLERISPAAYRKSHPWNLCSVFAFRLRVGS